jgi:beta-N-acetylhexosaminidase
VNDLEGTAALGRALAVELRALGIGLNFAPVVDVDTNPANPVIGDRSFGRTPALVAAHAAALISGMQGGGGGGVREALPRPRRHDQR